MSDPVGASAVESMLFRQVALELVKSAMPETTGGAGAVGDLFATTLADALAEGQGAQSS